MKKIVLVIIGIVVIIGLWVLGSYNSLVSMDEQVKSQWANVEAVYQRRLDLIPNVVNTVKGAAKQDLEVFTAIADARTRYGSAATVDEQAQAAGQLESALARLLVIVEAYPELKSQQAFQDLITELEGTENRISVERRRYNEEVRGYNTAVRRFPKNIIANLFGFEQHTLFEAAEGAENAPTVDFGA